MNDSEWRLARLLGEVVDIENPEGTRPLRFLMADRGEGYLTALTAKELAQEATGSDEAAASLPAPVGAGEDHAGAGDEFVREHSRTPTPAEAADIWSRWTGWQTLPLGGLLRVALVVVSDYGRGTHPDSGPRPADVRYPREAAIAALAALEYGGCQADPCPGPTAPDESMPCWRCSGLRDARAALQAPPDVAASDDERRFDLGNALGMDLQDESPSWRDLMRGIAELRAMATPPAPAGQDEAGTGLHRMSCVRERCAEDCPKRGTRDGHGRLPDDPLVGTPFPGPIEERADPHGSPMPPLWWDGCEVYGRCGDDYEVVYASMNGQWYPQGAAPLATLPEGAARLVPGGLVPGGGPVLAELDEAIGKVRISEPGDVAAISALRAARDRLADLTDPAALAAPEVAES